MNKITNQRAYMVTSALILIGPSMMHRKGGKTCSSTLDNAGEVDEKSQTKSPADLMSEQPVREIEKR